MNAVETDIKMENNKIEKKETFKGVNITLNLIPPEKKEEITKNKRFKSAVKVEIILTIIFIVFLAALFSFKYILNLNLSSLSSAYQKEGDSPQFVKIKDFDEKFGKLNSQVGEVLSAKRDQLYWTDLFVKLNGVIFPGIKIDSFSTQDYLATLKGTAESRSDLILFKEKLENEQCFSNINLPISDLVNKDNVSFQIDFIINSDCLKNK